ncbi:hypothetical protein EIP91_007249 [Steccherinum ochraceum]|uniref:F-box domain-containing protein n=1 Tax=Steccherinum ochraceum TaxID=92696 RepID=A0A4R0R4G7_9APHY|nr:hypothetical protein EIP91_007249 [Steccherinum ochraceum]
MKAAIPLHTLSPREIPEDVYQDILSHLDKPSIATCTLLCRHWNVAARQELFREIQLHCYKETKGLPAFLAFIASLQTQAATNNIKTLFVLGRPAHEGGKGVAKMTAHEIHRLLIHLPALQKLTLFRVLLRGTPEPPLPMASLLELRMVLSSFFVPRWLDIPEEMLRQSTENFSCGLIDLLNMFSHIGTLAVDSVYVQWDIESEIVSTIGHSPPSALMNALGRKLSSSLHPDKLVACTGQQQGWTSFCPCGDLEILELLSALNPFKEVHLEGPTTFTNPFLSNWGPDIQRLTVRIDDMFYKDGRLPVFDVGNCTKLASLRVTVPDLWSDNGALAVVNTFVHCPYTTSHLTLEFTPYPWMCWHFRSNAMDWNALDDGLCAREGLIGFNMIFPHDPFHPQPHYLDWIAKMPTRLPKLHA